MSIFFPPEVQQLLQHLIQAQPMRRAYLSERYVKCSKPQCPCEDNPEKRHGPYYSMTRKIAGQTHSRFLSPAQLELAKSQIQAGHRFRKRVDDYWEACERWANQELDNSQAAEEAAKKGASKKPLRKKSSKKLRNS